MRGKFLYYPTREGLLGMTDIKRGSLAHGTPPNINPNYHDVPMPDLEELSPSSARSEYHLRSSECFIALCKLTEILQKILPLVYSLRGKPGRETRKVVRSVETDLDQWEDDIPWQLQKVTRKNARVSGSCSLHLCLLSLKMLACRVSLHVSGLHESCIEYRVKEERILTFVAF